MSNYEKQTHREVGASFDAPHGPQHGITLKLENIPAVEMIGKAGVGNAKLDIDTAAQWDNGLKVALPSLDSVRAIRDAASAFIAFHERTVR